MRYARIAIGLAALMVMLSAGLVTVCDSDSSDALAIENGSIAYNSDDGFFLEVTDAGRSVIVRAVDGLSGPWVGQNIDGNVHAVLNGDSEINDEGTFRYIIVSGSSSIDGSISIVSLQFDRNGGTGGSDIGTKYLSQGYSGYTVDTPNWTKDGQTIMGWSTSPNGGVEYGLNDALPSDSSDVLYAVYGDPVYPTGVTITGAPEGNVDVGFEGNLVAEVVPEDAWYTAEWSSSDSEVVSVDGDGNIVANSPGTAVIRVTVADGIYDEVTIVVVGAVPVTGVELDRSEAGLSIGETIQLNASVVPADATNQAVSWSSSDESVVTVDENGLVTAEGEGIATITVTTAEGGFEAKCAVTVTSEPSTYYDVTVLESEGGTASVDPQRAQAGTIVTLTATPSEGYGLAGWRVVSGDVTIENNSFVMPASDVTIEPVFEKDPVPVTGVQVLGPASGIEGTSAEYTVTITPEEATDKTVTWSTSAPDVATVDQNGKVTFLAPGSVDIIAMASNGVDGKITVEVAAKTAESITASVGVYDEGDVFDWGDVTVTVHYNNGETETVTSGFDIDVSDGTALDEAGQFTATVSYGGMECTLTITVRAPGDVAISVTVIGGGPTNKVVLTVDGVETEFTRNGTLVVEEGSVVTVAYNTSGLLDPTITVGGEPISNGGTFVAGSDTTLRVVFFVDDDDDNPVNPPVVATGDDDDDVVYAVAIAAGVIVAVFVAVYVIYGRKD